GITACRGSGVEPRGDVPAGAARRTSGGMGAGRWPQPRGSPRRASALTRRPSDVVGVARRSGDLLPGPATAVCGRGRSDGPEPDADRAVADDAVAATWRAEPGDRGAMGRACQSPGWRYPGGGGSGLPGMGVDPVPGGDLFSSGAG